MVSELEQGRTPYGFAVTFDDGYVDNLTEAVPILEELELPATIFLVGDMIRAQEPFYWDNETRAEDRGRAVTRSELQKLNAHPLITVGAHTLTHPHLSTLDLEAQRTELAESKRLIEEMVGGQVEGFSYPFGTPNVDFTIETVRAVRDAGFRYACANIPGLIRRRADVLTLPRVLIRDWSSREMIARLGKYLP
jgi:peptidoglycan/xylan/chitin deacetylase (PgdA/CDA1 family)